MYIEINIEDFDETRLQEVYLQLTSLYLLARPGTETQRGVYEILNDFHERIEQGSFVPEIRNRLRGR